MKPFVKQFICEWVTFSTDTETYTQDTFEDLVGDEFEAMMFADDDHDIPLYIWTTNYVCCIKRSTRMINDISIEKIPRNPACS